MLSHAKLIIESEVDKYFETWWAAQYCKIGHSGVQFNTMMVVAKVAKLLWRPINGRSCNAAGWAHVLSALLLGKAAALIYVSLHACNLLQPHRLFPPVSGLRSRTTTKTLVLQCYRRSLLFHG
jgi:hypothetical protein